MESANYSLIQNVVFLDNVRILALGWARRLGQDSKIIKGPKDIWAPLLL